MIAVEEKELKDYLGALRRRKRSFLSVVGIVLAFSLLLAMFLPPTYQSTATILIEEQEIPAELVRSTITTFAAQRLQTINQRVMTRANLEKIIQKFDLYADDRKREPTEEIIKKMREDLSFEPISAEVVDPRTGQPSKATIAFSVSYDGRNPELAQRVANEVTSLYLEENLKSRTQKTAETSDFLQEETKQMGEYVSQVESRLAAFKENHIHSLPEQKELNLQFMDRTERELLDLDNQMRALEERKFYLEGQLALTKPDSPIASSTGERIMSPSDRLKTLQTEVLSLSSKYGKKHPDVVKIQHEIEALQKEVGGTNTSIEQVKELTRLRTQLASLREKYSPQHPDISRLQREISALQASIKEGRGTTETVAASPPDNPAYITLQAQRDGVVQDMSALLKKKRELKAKLNDYEHRLSETPDVERQYLALVRDYENAATRYRELKAKEMEAKIAGQLEKKSKGERFSVIEPPMLPESPIKPNRPAIAVLGVMLSLVCGLGYILAIENMDRSVRGARHLAALTGYPPLAVIPLLQTEHEEMTETRTRWIVLGASTAALLFAIFLVHWLWRPLDVLWYQALRRLEAIW